MAPELNLTPHMQRKRHIGQCLSHAVQTGWGHLKFISHHQLNVSAARQVLVKGYSFHPI